MRFSRQGYWSGLPFPSPGDDEAEAPIIWSPDVKSWLIRKIEGRRRRGQQKMRWLDGITNSVDISLFSTSVTFCFVNKFSSVTQSCLTLCDPMDCSTPTPRACSNSCPLSQWCRPAISFSVIPFSSCPQSFPSSRSFLLSQLFSTGGQRIGASASASVLLMNIQGWFPLGWTGLISLLSKGLSRVFSSTTVQKHQFFSILTFCLTKNSF